MTDFHRPPRLRQVAEPVELALPMPPPAPKRYPRTSLGQVLLVALLPSLLPPVVLALVTYMAGAATLTVITSAVLGGSLGLAVVVTTILSRRDEDARIRAEDREYEANWAAFEAALALASAEGNRVVQRERRILERDFPAPEAVAARTTQVASSTWERRVTDSDFLEFRLGAGRRKTCLRFPSTASSPDAALQSVVERLSYHDVAPVTVRMVPGTQDGMFGQDGAVFGTLSALVFQAAANHAPGDLRIAVFSRDERLCSWAKWLPHTRLAAGRETNYLVGRTGGEAARALRAIGRELGARAQPGDGPAYLVVADCRAWDSLPGRLAAWLPGASPAVALLTVQSRYEELAGDCDFVVDLSGGEGRVLRRVEPALAPTFAIEGLSPAAALEAALALALLSVVEGEGRGAIPSTARLADLLGAGANSPSGVTETWLRNRERFRLSAPIGVGLGDTPVEVDLRRDGPHGLLAGTTGSGKSEFLQSLVVSLAARVPPDLLNFVLIDYKGGAAFREILTLPHIVGLVTDLDERLSERALTSLRAEMKRREHLLATANPAAANIIEYQARPRDTPLANLVIIIDEFHRLVSEQPEFIDEMVRIAQQGRSLGVHLLLSTQKPSGVISDHIRANTNLRMCLRVTDEADSRDVLGGPEASLIPRDLPGRVYIRTGTEALRACQAGRISGLVPARRLEGADLHAETFLAPPAPRAVRRGGLLVRSVPQSPAAAAEEEKTDALDVVDERREVVEAIRQAARQGGFPEQQPPWLQHLPYPLTLDELPPAPGLRSSQLALGLVDEPEVQRQSPFVIDLEGGHVLVAGGSGTGKTSALLCLASAAARTRSASQLHVYGIDYAGGGLAPLANLAQCGGVAPQHDPPSVQWVLQALRDIVAERLAQTSGRENWPRVLVLADNFTALYTSLQNAEGAGDTADALFEVMEQGRNVGITFAITLERPESLRANILALMTTRLAFKLSETEGYSTLGLAQAKRFATVTAGRALVPGPVVHEVQLAAPERPHVADRLPALLGGPLPIAPLPPEVTHTEIRAMVGPDNRGWVVGLREGTRPLFSLAADESLVVLGPRRSGRSTALAVALSEALQTRTTSATVLNPRRSPQLRALAGSEGGRVFYGERPPDIQDLWEAVADEVERRFRSYEADSERLAPWVIVVDDADVLVIPSRAEDALKQVVLRGSDINVVLMVAADSQALRASYPSDLMRTVLAQRTGILLAPATPEDFDLFGARGRPARVPVGRGFFCQGGEKHAIQVARLD